jgi:DNA (cytosine-5)-methyltransferase 1
MFIGTNEILVNKDISIINENDVPEHDLLCGGFPCQDYSVAKTLDKSKGLEGKKGVLWWEIHRIVKAKTPRFILLENVDRLLKSPSSQRGRDFAVMLASLDDLGYGLEWRMIDASDYGFSQRRKRVFILAHQKGSSHYKALIENSPMDYLQSKGVFANAFPVKQIGMLFVPEFELGWKGDWDRLVKISDEFNAAKKGSPSLFSNAGVMIDGKFWTCKVNPNYDGSYQKLGDIILPPSSVGDEFVLEAEQLLREKGWIYQKGAKKEQRISPSGHTYSYNEGPVTFPDDLSKPSRTIITGEGGKGASRFKHVIIFEPNKSTVKRLDLTSESCKEVRQKLELTDKQWLRRLMPIELERLNGFPDNHTQGVSDGKRAFLMGNALVTGIINLISRNL